MDEDIDPEDTYGTLDAVVDLDRLLANAQDRLYEGIEPVGTRPATPIQKATLELAIPTISIAAGVRELIREGCLVPALVLLRSLIERTATLNYVIHVPGALEMWESGWPHQSRPSLRLRLSSMLRLSGDAADQLMEAMSAYNGMVHGDPKAAGQNRIQLPGDDMPVAITHDYGSPQRASAIALEAGVMLAYLSALIEVAYPENPLEPHE